MSSSAHVAVDQATRWSSAHLAKRAKGRAVTVTTRWKKAGVMTELKPGDIVRRVRGDSPSYPCNAVTEILGSRKLDFYESCFQLIYRPVAWNPLDPQDPSTWPPEGMYWGTWKNGRVEMMSFDPDSQFTWLRWQYCTHWMEIVPPVSPNAEEENQ